MCPITDEKYIIPTLVTMHSLLKKGIFNLSFNEKQRLRYNTFEEIEAVSVDGFSEKFGNKKI